MLYPLWLTAFLVLASEEEWRQIFHSLDRLHLFYGIPLPLRRLTSRKITAGTKAFQVFHTSRSVSVSLSFDLDFFQIEKCESIHAAKSRRVVLYFYSSQQPVKRQIVAIRRVIKIIQTAQESVPVNLFPLHAP